jgi:DNA-binding response OmpR family regulator
MKILIFDDETDILDLCTAILSSKNYEVYTSVDCSHLFDQLVRYEPDLILMDNKVCGSDGVTATKSIKQHPSFKNIPVVFFSANHNIVQLSQTAGADAYLAKPFNINELFAAIERFRS